MATTQRTRRTTLGVKHFLGRQLQHHECEKHYTLLRFLNLAFFLALAFLSPDCLSSFDS